MLLIIRLVCVFIFRWLFLFMVLWVFIVRLRMVSLNWCGFIIIVGRCFGILMWISMVGLSECLIRLCMFLISLCRVIVCGLRVCWWVKVSR